jgi:threonine dehydrogenase-like Zn-dependent dehydrogenase
VRLRAVQALLTRPGTARSTRVGEVPDPRPAADEVLLRTLEVGVCGTDREISEGLFGIPPAGERELVLGHELLAVVERAGHGFARGDLVTATVRRSCGRCAACAEGAPDACATGDYVERGITRLHGFAAELVAEAADQLIPVPPALGRLGALAEPASICARGLRHARAIGARQPWAPRRALVLGTGAIGMLATCLLRLDGWATWTAGRASGGEKAELVTALGAAYVATSTTPLTDLRADAGGFDLVLEAVGDAQLMLDALGLLGRGGVACLLGIDGRPRRIGLDGPVLGVDAVLENRVLFGSVNAHRRDWEAAVAGLAAARARWPEALERFVGLRVPLDRYADAFAFRGVKATLAIGGAGSEAA